MSLLAADFGDQHGRPAQPKPTRGLANDGLLTDIEASGERMLPKN
jgi:hypothetical protein